MMNQIFKYLMTHSLENPKEVDNLIISSFVFLNGIHVDENELIKGYLIKENSNQYNSFIEFRSILEREINHFGFEELIKLFEFVISPSDRIINGAVYTPNHIRNYIINETFKKKRNSLGIVKISDIACGCGGFLFDASRKLKESTQETYKKIFEDQIFGIDIQEYSIIRTKLLLSLLALKAGEDEKEFKFNLFVGDSLDFDWKNEVNLTSGFDIILGNPPYVCARNLDDDTKEKLKNWEVCQSGNSDLYIPFFQIAIENLAEDGVLGFITMNSFFKSLNGRGLRSYFQKKNLTFRILDFGSEQVFKSKNTYTCICFIENKTQNFISFTSVKSNELLSRKVFDKIYYKSLDAKKGWNLRDHKIISKIESTGISFGELYQTRHGIATLKNDVYIFNPIKEDKEYYYLQNGSLYQIEKGICRDIVNSNKLSREVDLSDLKEKVIFPYNNELKPKLLDESLIKEQFPKAYKYLKKKRVILNERDKGKGKYENWFAFGRTQSLEKVKNKMFFPKYSDITPSFIINSDDLLFYNGQAVIGHSEEEMLLIKKIMETKLFWYYIKTTSKPYSSDYFSLNGNYIRNFGICNLDEEELNFVLEENNQEILDAFFEKKYDVYLN